MDAFRPLRLWFKLLGIESEILTPDFQKMLMIELKIFEKVNLTLKIKVAKWNPCLKQEI